MPHYNAYDSFKTKKSIEKKQRAKEKALGKKNDDVDDFITNNCDNYGIVIEVRYDDAYVLLDDEVILAKLRKDINLVCNQVIFPGDKVVVSNDGSNYTITNLIISLISYLNKYPLNRRVLEAAIKAKKN